MKAVRLGAAIASLLSAVLYYLIGFEVLYVGESTNGVDPGLLAFGLSAGTTFVVCAVLLLVVERRLLWIVLATLNAVVIVAYFAMAGVRDPSFEWPGLAVKAAQLVTLGALALLAIRGPQVTRRFRARGPSSR
jgi:hypothetical protein